MSWVPSSPSSDAHDERLRPRAEGAAALAARLRAGELSVGTVARSLAERLAADPHRAWAAVDETDLLAQAAALDALDLEARRRLAMFGVPVAIKDAFDTATLPTAYGSQLYAGHRPQRDAGAVQMLRSAGALIAGKTKCAEFSWMTAPDTVNPLDASRTPGGSSSGSAAAVAAGDVPLATGTQTAGSVIRPASYCGVLGFKPTFGAFPRDGVMPLSATLDTVGVFARTIEDLVLVAGVLASADPREVTIRIARPLTADRDIAEPRLAFARTPFWGRIEPDAREAIDQAIDAARQGGVTLQELDLGEPLAALADAQVTIHHVEAAAALAPELRDHPDSLSAPLREALEQGAAIDGDRYGDALATVRRWVGSLDELLSAYDAVLAPSALGVPPSGLDFTGDPLFCRAFTLAGVPCVSLPLAWTPAGLPVGLQLVAATGRDRRLLRAADWLLERVPVSRRATGDHSVVMPRAGLEPAPPD